MRSLENPLKKKESPFMSKYTTQSSTLQQDTENNLIYSPNYTMVPNVIFDYWMPKLSHPAFKVLMCICRNTIGWHEKSTGLSYHQIHESTGLAVSTIQLSIKDLIKENLIYMKSGVNKQTNEVNTYHLHIINKKQPIYRESVDVCRQSVDPYTESRHTPIPTVGNIKESTKEKEKEIYKEKKSKIQFSETEMSLVGMSLKDIELWQEKFPDKDVLNELDRMGKWLYSNPSRRKSDYLKFIFNWLSKKEEDFKSSNTEYKPAPVDPIIIEKRKKWANTPIDKGGGKYSCQGGNGQPENHGFLVVDGTYSEFYRYDENSEFWKKYKL